MIEPAIERALGTSETASHSSWSPLAGPVKSTPITTNSVRGWAYVPPQVHSLSRKPETLALEEIVAGKLSVEQRDDE